MTAPTGMAAFGRPVPPGRRSAALAAVRAMVGPEVTLDAAMALVDGVSIRIERDDPYDALDYATNTAAPVHVSAPFAGRQEHASDRLLLDLTGGYRLVATLCTEAAS